MQLERNKSYLGDCVKLMQSLFDESVDVILTDPPYLYLKNQKLDRPFDETAYFSEAKRVLKKDGFMVLFGRGTSFYRWNTRLADLGFAFKEEIVWDKQRSTSPLMAVSRVHETVSIHTKGKGTINRSKVPYTEMKSSDVASAIADIKRLRTILKNTKSLDAVLSLLENAASNEKPVRNDRTYTNSFTKFAVTINKGKSGNRCANAMQSIVYGMNEKSIIKGVGDNYTAIHPTQKPVRLLERLLALVCKVEQGKHLPLVLDTFRGSGSTDIACINFGCDYISFEIDKDCFELANERVENYKNDRLMESINNLLKNK